MLSLRHRPNIFSGGLEGRRSAGYFHFSNASFPVKPVSRQVISFNGHLAITFSTAEELIFVFPSTRLSVVCRFTVLSTALLAFAGLGSSAVAQTAPQLLPYTTKLIAGGGTQVVGLNGTCPVSGNKSVDAYGDGCLATEIELGNTATGAATPGARSAVADGNGNVFFTDYNNGLVRRVDVITGIVSAVAGGGTATAGTSSGLLGTAVKLSHPVGIAFAPNGDLYFSDTGNAQVFKIASTGGFITTSGIISLVAGNTAGTYGYAASNATTTIVAATQGYLHSPYGIAFDTKGDLFIVDEYTEAILAVNTNATGTNIVNGVSVAAGTIWKVAGTSSSATYAPYCQNGTATGYGCNYGLYSEDVPANTTSFDSTYSVTVDPNGVVYAGVEYYDSVFKVTNPAPPPPPAALLPGILSTFAGIQDTVGVKPTIAKRGVAGSFGIGSTFGLAADLNSNVYIGDASSGVVWRVDNAGQLMYVVAGGATTFCSAATDAYGDGCPATQSKFGSSGSGNYATATLPGPGIYGITSDAYSDLFVGDTETNLVREIASGTQFGNVGASQTDNVDIHFAANDTPITSGAYTITIGASIFTVGTATCTLNSDKTTDCVLPITANPTVLGAFTGTLQVQAVTGGTVTFPLSGNFVQSPITRTAVSATASTSSCSGSTIYPTTATIKLTAALTANGPSAPTGTIIFSSNGTPLAPVTGVAVSNIGTTASPVYGATLTETFPTAASYSITATYVPTVGSYFDGSTSASAAKFSTSLPTFTTSVNTSQEQSTIIPGQTALYSFNVAQNVYSGTITFTCSGLPTGAACVFSPSSITASGCSTTSVVALSITTQQPVAASSGSFGGTGHGHWQMVGVLVGFTMALLIGIRRRKHGLRYGQMWMALALLLAASGAVACGTGSVAGTPLGTSTVTVKAAGTDGTVTTFTVPLVIN